MTLNTSKPIKRGEEKVKELSEEEKEIIREAKMKYKLGAKTRKGDRAGLWHFTNFC